MRIETEVKLDYSDVLIRPKRSTLESRKDVILERSFTFLHSKKTWSGIPIMAANMADTGTFSIANEFVKYKMITTLHKYYSVDKLSKELPLFNNPQYISYTMGIRDEDFSKLDEVLKLGLDKYFDFICLDVPNGYLERFVDSVRRVRSLCPDHIIIAGNVVTNEMVEELLINGADIVKVGIGSGAACLTRRKAGVGYPQLSAVIECADAAHGISHGNGCGLIIADGGVANPGDIAKAFCAGADFSLNGSFFAGFEQSEGELIEENGKKYKMHFGSSSTTALEKFYGKVATHRASEGRTTKIPYKGDINPFILDLLGSLRSAGTYIGARRIKEFPKRATFLLVNRQLNTRLEQFDV
ncbi:GMP reductase [Candidatus Woesearchaeota archaeon]|nr:GMP reductase [Candidatus Woesearchaeota archaeon]